MTGTRLRVDKRKSSTQVRRPDSGLLQKGGCEMMESWTKVMTVGCREALEDSSSLPAKELKRDNTPSTAGRSAGKL